MLTIRLTRKGRKNQPFFNVVVIDKRRAAKGGRATEILGYIDPLTKKKSLKKDRILHWLKVGAKASPTVHNLLVSEKIIEAKKIAKHKKSKKKEVESAQPSAPAETIAPAASELPVAAEAPTQPVKTEQNVGDPVSPETAVTPEVPKTEEKSPEKSRLQSNRGSSIESGPAEQTPKST